MERIQLFDLMGELTRGKDLAAVSEIAKIAKRRRAA